MTIPALTGAQASPARSAQSAHAWSRASQADQLRALERQRLHALVGQIIWEQATAIPNNFDLFLRSIEPPGQS